MNIVFYVLVLCVLAILFFLLSNLFYWIGLLAIKISNKFKNNMNR